MPAGGSVELKPGGYHLMFMGLKQPMKQGETVEVTLSFEKAGEVDQSIGVSSTLRKWISPPSDWRPIGPARTSAPPASLTFFPLT